MELTSGQKGGLIFGGAIVIAGIVLSTLVFPFWNLIREDVYEEVTILANQDGICYVETEDNVPKTIEDCTKNVGDIVTIKFGRDLAWATIVEP
ncbi:hypothetical protein [Nitrosopumilus sp.]|uniref:hypothetical protein n=1 Tax=Nitrosopumilus sp. TaxID=2024843 RepID=UPI00260E1AFD|nr:hypothetical protein [Nitrosopumilus sp.]